MAVLPFLLSPTGQKELPLSLMALGIAASCAFATPMATPPNTLVLGPGGFSFNDYAKVGVPMCVISLIVCLVVIPIVWPFGM